MTYFPLLLLGLTLFSLGFLYQHTRIQDWDEKLFLRLNQILNRPLLIRGFIILWGLGITPFTLICLAVMTIRNPEQGVIGGVVYGVFAGIERGVKLALKRPRPFDRFPHSVTMLQPSHPDDPSFPSGDCLRAWFLVLVIGFGFGGHTALLISLFFLACLVSLGRIALGVHFPLDTLAGTGLGISAGSVSLLLWSLVAGY